MVCSCNQCENKADFQCDGKTYSTTYKLTCPLHSLLYEIECNARANKSDQLVHPKLGRGHSNFVEATHNVFIRYRSKDVYLSSIHYEVSTNLGLLQSNMTYMYENISKEEHWILLILEQLNLPVWDCMKEAIKKFNEKRYKTLQISKRNSVKKRRIELKNDRIEDSKRRIKFTKQHGNDTYGMDTKRVSGKKSSVKKQSSQKQRSNTELLIVTDDEMLNYSSDNDEDEIYNPSDCTCGSYGRSHKKSCPSNPYNLYPPKPKQSSSPCFCNGKDTKRMIICDGSLCAKRFHFECVDISQWRI